MDLEMKILIVEKNLTIKNVYDLKKIAAEIKKDLGF